MKNSCSVCGKERKVYTTFGKLVCKPCIKKRKTRDGHSGMIYKEGVNPSDYLIDEKELTLVKVKKSHPLFVKWFFEHYPESKGIVGRQLNYLIYLEGEPVGIIGFASPPLAYRKFRKFFKRSEDETPAEVAKSFLNNNVFRLVIRKKNLATQVLALARRTIKEDYKKRYGDTLRGIVTFVKPPRTGALYKADNWTYIGKTKGIKVERRGEDWLDKQYKQGIRKHIFVYVY